ncbi:hypothetical protein [Pseudosulfitobacter pseudonitzschiae]|uniref:hypothetical protein n=1 Tax=Pseudosulfitobacter pseudonitzschiae TaxID=1402135 RepID=UPI003B75E23F
MFEKLKKMISLSKDLPQAAAGRVQEPDNLSPDDHAVSSKGNVGSSGQPPLLRVTVPLSEVALGDPVIMGLDPKLLQRRQIRNPEAFSLFETVMKKTGILDSIPLSATKYIEKMQNAYADHLAKSMMFISRRDQFEGCRRLMILGESIMRSPEKLIVMIDDRGLLRCSLVSRIDPDAARDVSSVAEVLELMRHGIEGWEIQAYTPDFNLNKRTKSAKVLAHEAVDWLPVMRWENKLDPNEDPVAIEGEPKTRREKKALRDARRDINAAVNRANGQIRGIIRNRHVGRQNFVRWAICDALDPDILRTMRGTTRTSIKDCMRLCATEFDTVTKTRTDEDDRLSKFRMQAIKAFPILSDKFLQNPLYQREIDAGLPLIPFIAEDHGVREQDVRKLLGLTWQKAAVSPNSADVRINQIYALPGSHQPVKRQDYRDLDLLTEFGREIYRETLSQVMERLGENGDPFRFNHKLRENPPRDIRDSIGFLMEKLYIPALMHRAMQFATEKDLDLETEAFDQHALAQRITSEFKVKELIELSERYHRNIHRYEDRISKIEVENSWPAFVGAINLSKGITASEITSSDRMSYQGRHENHCVGGYVSNVLNATGQKATFIFSLEDGEGILSTVEMRVRIKETRRSIPDGAPDAFEVVETLKADIAQNRAMSNEAPSGVAIKNADLLAREIEKIDAGTFTEYLKKLDGHNAVQREVNKIPRSIRSAGYSPYRKDHLMDAWDELSTLLPRSVRKMGLDGFIDSFDLKGVKFSHSPGNRQVNPWDEDYFGEISKKKLALAATVDAPLPALDLDRGEEYVDDAPIHMAAE